MNLAIRPATTADARAIVDIYNPYIADTIVTFEETPIDTGEMAGRLAEVAATALPWLVAERDGSVVGYAYASKWKGRCAYRYSVETTVYLDRAHVGRGIGRQLYDALFARLRVAGMHVAIGGIALPNAASVALHEAMGMRQVAQFAQVGFKFGRWIDVGYWQVEL